MESPKNLQKLQKIASRINEYKIIRLVGDGAYGAVYEAQHIETKYKVAIKHINLDLSSPKEIYHKQLIMAIREIDILRQLSEVKDNFYTIKLLDAFVNDSALKESSKVSDLFLVTDYYEKDLFTVLRDSNYQLDEEQAITLIYNLLISLKFMEQVGLLHRDIKPSNILVTEYCQVKICDFGMARGVQTPPQTKKAKQYRTRPLSPVTYTRWYRPPEVILQNQQSNSKGDIWSFGCIVSEILKSLLRDMKDQDIIEYLENVVLFKGTSCYPLSPCEMKNQKTQRISDKDQLVKIIQVLSQDKKLDKESFKQEELFKFYSKVYDFAQTKPKPTIAEIHKGLSPKLIEVLEKCLKMDPSDRISIDECINLSVFDHLRVHFDTSKLPTEKITIRIDNQKMKEDSQTFKEYSVKSLQEYLVNMMADEEDKQ